MTITEIKFKTETPRKAIWKIWTDIENRRVWDKEVEYSSLSGDFKVSATEILSRRNRNT
jgi:hypothetical protein